MSFFFIPFEPVVSLGFMKPKVFTKKYLQKYIVFYKILYYNFATYKEFEKIKFIPSSKLYYKFSVYLYERIIWLMESKNGTPDISIGSRGNLNKKDLLD